MLAAVVVNDLLSYGQKLEKLILYKSSFGP